MTSDAVDNVKRREFISLTGLGLLAAPAGRLDMAWAEVQDSGSVGGRNGLSSDPLRPQFHLLPPSGRVGDPCAPRFFQGEYHVFYHGNVGGNGWHHAVSKDLVHWRHMPIALAPTSGGIDARGTFTGGVLPTNEGAAVIYTAVTQTDHANETIRAEGLREVQAIATSTDPDLRNWKKSAIAAIDGPPRGMEVTGFRDPFAWKDGDTWYMGIGSGFPHVGGAVLLYRSHDMAHWEYLHPLATGTWNGKLYSNPVPSGEMWECPDFFALGNRHVLIYSTEHTTCWEVGTFDQAELRFHSERKGILDHGLYYAPRSMQDASGRRLLWGWVQEGRELKGAADVGWSGCISLPRVLTLDKDGALLMSVAPELQSLRRNTAQIHDPRNTPALNAWLARRPILNRAGELLCEIRAAEGEWSMEGRFASGQPPMFTLTYTHANHRPCIAIGDKLIPLNPGAGDVSTVHVWIDASVIEIFIDNREVVTLRDYADAGTPSELRIVWNGTADLLQRLLIADIEPQRPLLAPNAF